MARQALSSDESAESAASATRAARDAADPWAAAIRRDDWDAAWRVSDAVLARHCAAAIDCSTWPRHLQFVWNGTAIEGRRVLVRCYHGLGDTLQFVRFLKPLRERAARVTLWVQPALLDLLRPAAGVDAVLPLHDGRPEIDYDVDMEIMETAHVLRVTGSQLWSGAYIAALPAPPLHSSAKAAIGLVWRSGSWNPRRSIPPGVLARLRTIPDVDWYSLHYPAEPLPFPMVDIGCADLGQLAARMQGLDLVISVDTMAAHLAGALGVRVWTLLPSFPDWRWNDRGSRTRWYPTMRLLRQRGNQGWPDLIARLEVLLRTMLAREEITP